MPARSTGKLRRHSLVTTSEAGSGHPTTCMSAADIASVLFFDEMRCDPSDPTGRDADILVLSQGHAAPLPWAALGEAGAIREDIMTLREHSSVLEGHPTPLSPWVRVATGSLGQGLCAASGMAWARRLDGSQGRVFVLLGDGEMAEGSVWEAAQFVSFHGLGNVCAIVDANRLGQSDNWLKTNIESARETLTQEMQEVELSVKFRDAQDYQRAGRLQEALTLYIEVAAVDQEYPGLAESLEEVKQEVALESQYSEAMQLIDQGDYPTALDLLRGIENVDPYYKDVAILVTDLEDKFILNELLSEAEEAYMTQDWEKAIEGYANLRTMDPQYQSSQVIDRLKTSYINAAKAVLADENSTVEDRGEGG